MLALTRASDPAPNGMRPVRIFISSPGDVLDERERARLVVEELRRRHVGRLDLHAVAWEQRPPQASISFQQGIDLVLADLGIDVAVFSLWSRLGTPLGDALRKPDGTEYRSGTERAEAAEVYGSHTAWASFRGQWASAEESCTRACEATATAVKSGAARPADFERAQAALAGLRRQRSAPP